MKEPLSVSKNRIACLDLERGVAFSVKPKGIVHSPLHRGVRMSKSQRESGRGVLEIFPQFLQDVAGLATGCKAWLLTYRAELETGTRASAKGKLPSLGDVLADPTVRRFHPIGIDQVTIVGIDGLMLQVEGLEALDGSPVLDLQAITQETH